ncbi:hypothetical protein WN55_05431 [Dufourea novaeangliae]|uniref:Uncharacterized protein n=1 Tax=Dufourea novaeangliae TaxID=178035 RepID=A0A154P0M1_DUFNO|nr:hypothetical protein WN55_05431 [Dufourea novaeangliae]
MQLEKTATQMGLTSQLLVVFILFSSSFSFVKIIDILTKITDPCKYYVVPTISVKNIDRQISIYIAHCYDEHGDSGITIQCFLTKIYEQVVKCSESTIEDIKAKSLNELKVISKSAFQKCSED